MRTDVEAHGYIRQPLVAFKGGRTTSNWIEEDKPAWTGFSSWNNYMNDFARISKQKGYKTLRAFLENKGASCGYTESNTTPRAIPRDGKVIFAHSNVGFVHPGPCELWLDNKMILHKDDCQKASPGVKAVMPVDFSSCKGTCMLRMYWLGFQDQGQRWQTCKYCVPVKKGGKRLLRDE
ncbi:hypothetical protein FI667_g13064, partial [Globisporangium splendens]